MQEVFVIKEKEFVVITINEEIVITTETELPGVVTIGVQGPAGPAGSAGSSIVFYTAGESLSGHRAVILTGNEKAFYADSSSNNHLNKIIGITTGAAVVNTLASIQTYGELAEPSWNWDLTKPIFAGTTGALVQAVPSSGFIQQIATVISSTKIFINIQPAIKVG